MFDKAKMWLDVATDYVNKKNLVIPTNIGKDIIVNPSTMITKNYITSITKVVDLQGNTPKALISILSNTLIDEGLNVELDYTFQMRRWVPEINAAVNQNEKLWNLMARLEVKSTRNQIIRATELLNTLELVKGGTPTYKGMMIIFTRAKNGSDLQRATNLINRQLKINGVTYMNSISVKEDFPKYSIASRQRAKPKEDGYSIYSHELLAQLLPNKGDITAVKRGPIIATDVINNTPVTFHPSLVRNDNRNGIILAASGKGKTVMAINLLASFLEYGYRAQVDDIKGTEFNRICEAASGYNIDLTINSTQYINVFKLSTEEMKDLRIYSVTDYLTEKKELAVEFLTILVGRNGDSRVQVKNYLSSFISRMYEKLGVSSNNVNTFYRSECLSLVKVYDLLREYSTTVNSRELVKSNDILREISTYCSSTGSSSKYFEKEYEIGKIMKSPLIVFNHGRFDSTVVSDERLSNIRVLYRNYLSKRHLNYGLSIDKDTLCIMEEAQSIIGSKSLVDEYVSNFVLGRARRQTNILLCNTLSGLGELQGIFDNLTFKILGPIKRSDLETDTARVEAKKLLRLDDVDALLDVADQYSNSFVFYSDLEGQMIRKVIRVNLPKDGSLYIYDPRSKREVNKD